MPRSSAPKKGTIQMRATRFRLEAGCISWVARADTDKQNTAMETLLGPQCVAQNSSRPFGRDLTTAELNDILAGNVGNNPEKKRFVNRANEELESLVARLSKDADTSNQVSGSRMKSMKRMMQEEQEENNLVSCIDPAILASESSPIKKSKNGQRNQTSAKAGRVQDSNSEEPRSSTTKPGYSLKRFIGSHSALVAIVYGRSSDMVPPVKHHTSPRSDTSGESKSSDGGESDEGDDSGKADEKKKSGVPCPCDECMGTQESANRNGNESAEQDGSEGTGEIEDDGADQIDGTLNQNHVNVADQFDVSSSSDNDDSDSTVEWPEKRRWSS